MSSADEHRLAILAEREEGIRLALEYPSGVMRPGHYVAHYSRAELLDELNAIARERRGLQSRQPRRPAAVPPEGRTAGAGHPAPARHQRRNTLKLSHLVIAADAAAVIYVEKVLIAGHKATPGHPAVAPAGPKELIIVGLIFALPALLILLTAWLRGRAPAAPPAPRRPGYNAFGPRP